MSSDKIKRLYSEYYNLIGYMNVGNNFDFQQIPKTNMIKVMSYNILANVQLNDTATYHNSRGRRISDTIISDRPDFAMLQEVDTIKDSMETLRLEEIYNFIYVERGKGYADGLMTLYDKNRFILVQEKLVYFDEEAKKFIQEFGEENMVRFEKPKIFHLMIFEDLLYDNKPLCVCNTHFEHDPRKDDTKYLQMVMTFNIATQYVNYFDEVMKNTKMTPIVLLGDYNCRPDSNAMNIIYNRPPVKERVEPEFFDAYADLFIKHGKIAHKLLDTESMQKFGFKNAYSFYQKAVQNEMDVKGKEFELLNLSNNLIQTEQNEG